MTYPPLNKLELLPSHPPTWPEGALIFYLVLSMFGILWPSACFSYICDTDSLCIGSALPNDLCHHICNNTLLTVTVLGFLLIVLFYV